MYLSRNTNNNINRSVPLNLEEVDCSFNEITEIPNLSQHRFLKKLNLSNNKISKIDGLSANSNLMVGSGLTYIKIALKL